MKKCIVNYITRNAWHPHGQERLAKSLKMVGFDGDVLLFDNTNFKCVRHHKTPYAFKLHVIKEAQRLGYDLALWVDASFWAITPVAEVFTMIEADGFLCQNSDYVLGQWSSDESLKHLGIDREEAFKMFMFSGGFMGYNLRDAKTLAFFEEFLHEADRGVAFRGSWTNRKQEVSSDPRVMGHRHDMVVGTHLLHKHGLKMHGSNSFFSYYGWYEAYKVEKQLEGKVPFVIEGGDREI